MSTKHGCLITAPFRFPSWSSPAVLMVNDDERPAPTVATTGEQEMAGGEGGE